jgi:nucleosome binding factor SPN SPT16 subunit
MQFDETGNRRRKHRYGDEEDRRLEMDMDENDQFMGTRLEEQMLHVAEKHVDMLTEMQFDETGNRRRKHRYGDEEEFEAEQEERRRRAALDSDHDRRLEMDMDENDQFMGTRLEEQMLHVAEKHGINWLKLGTAVQ